MSDTKSVGVLALQGGVEEHCSMLEKVGVVPKKVRKINDLEGIDGIILPGGESTTISKSLQLNGMFPVLQEKIRQGLPVWGTCAGMILLADRVENTREDSPSLGGIDMTVRRNAFGRQVDSFEAQIEVRGVPTPVDALFIRAPWVGECGQGVGILSTTPVPGTEQEAIVAVQQGYLLATSFHPELTGDLQMHQYFVEQVMNG